ncbi:MAG: DUF4268 domain-containing protein [Desulfuromonadales bacterium]|nr:DUF4268 domain-containing protein [Desulfuromonadales bacterium]
MVGKLAQVALREIWRHEALDFTSWLADNFDILKEQLGLDLTFEQREKAVGSFSADILAKDVAGRLVVIENQLERTDHDHLGKVLTYLANLDAKVAIWISSDPRPEHITTIDYLNEIAPTDTEFYLIKLQAYKIGSSDPAPLFTIEAGPSVERRAVGETKKQLADKDKRRYEFFERLLERCRYKTNLFSNISPVGYQNWVNAGAGKSGLMWTFEAMEKSSRVDLFLCATTAEVNQKRFEALLAHKEEIEQRYGEPLLWEYKEGRKQQYLRSYSPLGGVGVAEESKWESIHNDLIDRLVRLERALREFLRQID